MSDSLVWADLERAYGLLRALPPAPVKIWFIDRPAEYYQVKQACYSAGLFQIDSLSGLPVVDWRSSGFDPETEIIANKDDDLNKLRLDNYSDKRVYPWICQVPGIWAEWSNGTFTGIELTQKERGVLKKAHK